MLTSLHLALLKKVKFYNIRVVYVTSQQLIAKGIIDNAIENSTHFPSLLALFL